MKRLFTSRGATAAATAVLVLMVAGGGYAIASAGGTIHACASKRSGSLRLATNCKKSERGLSWNAVGPQGPKGATGAQGPQGSQGTPGQTGPAGPFPATLPSGKTIVGAYGMGNNGGAGDVAEADISYLYSAPGQTAVFVPAGGSNAHCPGNSNSPSANPGFTCVYETSSVNAGSRGINWSKSAGVGLYMFSTASGFFESVGTWAATAP